MPGGRTFDSFRRYQMALNAVACSLLSGRIAGDVLCLGVPAMLLTDKQCSQLFGVAPRKKIAAPRWWLGEKELPDPFDLFELLGARLTCVDAIAHDGREVVADLNYPQEFGKFDLVIDAGTTEHCFNVGQAIVTAAEAVKVGGRIFHTNPVSMGNHAFYNFCPTLMVDFYRANGFKVEALEVRDKKGEGARQKYHPTDRFALDDNWGMYFMAVRKDVVPLKYPIQSKYQ